VLHQLTVRGVKVKSMLSWRHVGFTPDTIAYRKKDRLLAVCGESDRIKTFRYRYLCILTSNERFAPEENVYNTRNLCLNATQRIRNVEPLVETNHN